MMSPRHVTTDSVHQCSVLGTPPSWSRSSRGPWVGIQIANASRRSHIGLINLRRSLYFHRYSYSFSGKRSRRSSRYQAARPATEAAWKSTATWRQGDPHLRKECLSISIVCGSENPGNMILRFSGSIMRYHRKRQSRQDSSHSSLTLSGHQKPSFSLYWASGALDDEQQVYYRPGSVPRQVTSFDNLSPYRRCEAGFPCVGAKPTRPGRAARPHPVRSAAACRGSRRPSEWRRPCRPCPLAGCTKGLMSSRRIKAQ